MVFRMNSSLTCMTGRFLDFGDDVAGYVFESMSFNSFACFCACACYSQASSAEEEFQQVKQKPQRTLLVVVGKESRSRLVKFPSCMVSVGFASTADRK